MPGTRLLRFLALQGESLELENALSDLTMPSSFLPIYPLPHQTWQTDLNMAGITCYNVTKWCKRQEMEEYITCLVSDGKRKLHSRCIFYPQMPVINCRHVKFHESALENVLNHLFSNLNVPLSSLLKPQLSVHCNTKSVLKDRRVILFGT